MSYMEDYKSKLVTADEAVKVVKSGDLVHYGEFVMCSHVSGCSPGQKDR